MLKTFDFILIGVIKLEKDTIDLLRADWALLTQPNRLEKLIKTYDGELKLAPTDPTQLVQPIELPMLRDELPAVEVADDKDGKAGKQKKTAENGRKPADKIVTGSVKP